MRFDGAHKKDQWLVQDLGKHVQWHAVCPEVAMGLGIPREPVRLVRDSKNQPIRFVGVRSQTDHTDLARKTCVRLVKKLPQLDGYVLKNRSPSCGLERVKVYGKNNIPQMNGIGFFAEELLNRFPHLPVIEEGKLNSAIHKEHFITQVFTQFHLKQIPAKTSAIQNFHQTHKFLLLAYDERGMRKLGKIAANSIKRKPSDVLAEYREEFSSALKNPASKGARTNAIQHIFGFLKKEMGPEEKAHALELISQYKAGTMPFVGIMTLLTHLVQKHSVKYIANQKFFHPYPRELNIYTEV